MGEKKQLGKKGRLRRRISWEEERVNWEEESVGKKVRLVRSMEY